MVHLLACNLNILPLDEVCFYSFSTWGGGVDQKQQGRCFLQKLRNFCAAVFSLLLPDLIRLMDLQQSTDFLEKKTYWRF